ncbi:MAG: UDP-N-acetylmuramoyl-L-alanine--D-glutamate ligase [Calditrichia bacterium]
MFLVSKDKVKNRKQLEGAAVSVLGAARSGIALARLLAANGARVLLSDIKPVSEWPVDENELKSQGINYEGGGHSEEVLASALICISPGLPLTIPVLQKAQQRNIPILGELEVASWFCPAPIIGITGSNGKTTTTTLTGRILARKYPAIVAGNIGSPLAGLVTDARENGLVVVEISSFQLETIHSFHPGMAVIMNLTPNHLDRYPSFEAYAEAKLNILKNLTEEDLLIFNRDDEFLSGRLRSVKPRVLQFSLQKHPYDGAYWEGKEIVLQLEGRSERMRIEKSNLRGPHNRYNMMVAALIGRLWKVGEEEIIQTIQEFEGIEHRLEFVRELDGVRYFNDSKATTVDSLGYALQSFEEPIVLIAGGKDKGGDFSELNELIRQKVKKAILIGQASGRMAESWQRTVPLQKAATLEEAVQAARNAASAGDVVLLSPACSSFDMFKDYEDRGRVFKIIVKGLAE